MAVSYSHLFLDISSSNSAMMTYIHYKPDCNLKS